MRITTHDFTQTPANPCYSGAYGVTADLTINVTDPPACIPPTDLMVENIADTTADVTVEILEDGDVIRTLLDDVARNDGSNSVTWNGKDIIYEGQKYQGIGFVDLWDDFYADILIA